jgi:hypothetical protein
MDERTLKTLRAMAWQRAKGELQAYLETFWPSYDRHGEKIENGFVEANQRIKDFIKDFEDNAT